MIPIEKDKIEWNCFGIPDAGDSAYRQDFNRNRYLLKKTGDSFTGYVNEKIAFEKKTGYIVVTNAAGKLQSEKKL